MILTKNDLSKKRNNKKFEKNNKNLRQENKKPNNKYDNRYFNKKYSKNDNSQVTNEKNIAKNSEIFDDKKLDKKKIYSPTINDNDLKRNNINSMKTRNKINKNQTREDNDMKEMITDFSNKILYDNIYNNIRKENKMIKQKNTSMEQRHKKIDEELLLDENIEEDNKINNIYSRPSRDNSPNSQLKENFGNQFNIKDAKNILNINYFYDKSSSNLENDNDIFYTSHYKSKIRKKIKVIDSRNKYNSLIINEKKNDYTIPNKTTSSFYIRKNPINLVKHINSNYQKDGEIPNNEYINNKKYMETEEINNKFKTNGIRYHSTFNRNANNYTPERFYTNTINNYINYKFGQNDKKIIRRNGNKIKIFKKNNNTSIQEYKLSLGNEDESDNYLESYENDNISSFQNNRNIKHIFKNNIDKNNQELNDIKKYYQYFTKNIKPISISQFEIKNNKPKINLPKKNYINVNKAQNISFQNRNIFQNKKGVNNKLFEKNKIFGEKPNLNGLLKDQKNNAIIKKQKNKSLEFIGNIAINSEQKIFFNNDSLKVFPNEKFEILITKENKFIFNTEEEIIDYIYNKFEEERKKKSYFNRKLRFTGFVLTKKYKGKNLCDIRIEDNIEQINQQLKNENILINDKRVVFKFFEEINNIDLLEEENKKLREEKEKLNKKDIIKNELIKKLDNEKQSLNEELIKLKKEIEELKEKKEK